MSDVRVTCINKRNRVDSHEGITHLGGSTWRWTRQEVIASIEARTNTFFTLNGKRAEVVVRRGPNGKFAQTLADGQWTNNLLSLPECATG